VCTTRCKCCKGRTNSSDEDLFSSTKSRENRKDMYTPNLTFLQNTKMKDAKSLWEGNSYMTVSYFLSMLKAFFRIISRVQLKSWAE
jgi:hypothetical protein